jgi:WD repeat-containing protein 35
VSRSFITGQAFIKLESMPTLPGPKREEYADLAMSIFLKNPPIDPRALRETREKTGAAARWVRGRG